RSPPANSPPAPGRRTTRRGRVMTLRAAGAILPTWGTFEAPAQAAAARGPRTVASAHGKSGTGKAMRKIPEGTRGQLWWMRHSRRRRRQVAPAFPHLQFLLHLRSLVERGVHLRSLTERGRPLSIAFSGVRCSMHG